MFEFDRTPSPHIFHSESLGNHALSNYLFPSKYRQHNSICTSPNNENLDKIYNCRQPSIKIDYKNARAELRRVRTAREDLILDVV